MIWSTSASVGFAGSFYECMSGACGFGGRDSETHLGVHGAGLAWCGGFLQMGRLALEQTRLMVEQTLTVEDV
jgi:hypothetical protein